MSDWWEPFYDEWLALMLLRNDTAEAAAETERTVDFLVEQLELEPGMRVFDQCCGNGRLALRLAERGHRVLGVDQAEAYVEAASAAADELGLSGDFEAGDAFEYVADPPCDAALNWWTSFGYAADDASNARMLSRAFASLRPGGRFALDVLNLPGVLRGFRPEVVNRRQLPGGELLLIRESRVDLAAGALLKTWTYVLPDGKRVVHRSRVRLYLPHRIGELLSEVGFRDIRFHGSVAGEPLDLDSPRCILVARRPA